MGLASLLFVVGSGCNNEESEASTRKQREEHASWHEAPVPVASLHEPAPVPDHVLAARLQRDARRRKREANMALSVMDVAASAMEGAPDTEMKATTAGRAPEADVAELHGHAGEKKAHGRNKHRGERKTEE